MVIVKTIITTTITSTGNTQPEKIFCYALHKNFFSFSVNKTHNGVVNKRNLNFIIIVVVVVLFILLLFIKMKTNKNKRKEKQLTTRTRK